MTPLVARLLDRLDERVGLRGPARKTMNKIFPHDWTFLLGEVALFSFVILVLTGIFLTMFYQPSVDRVIYTGSLEVYRGRELPAAFESIVRLSHDVPGGLLFRRLHRGAAYIFIAGLVFHAIRVLLTGAFRRPREVNYHIGLILTMLALGLAATGQSLPYDMVEGNALRIAHSFLLSIPFVGEQVSFWVFGGDFFGDAIPRFYVIHILILPGAFAALVTAHLLIIVRQQHTQFPRPSVDGHRYVYGEPLWPSQFATSTSLFVGLAGVLTLFSVIAPWADVALHGPAEPGISSSAAHPDWWLFWLEGALVLWPRLELYPLPGVVISAPFVAGVLLPGAAFVFLFAFPWLDRRLHPYEGDVHVLERPLDRPVRAALVLGGVAFLLTVSLAANVDVFARYMHVPVEWVIVFFRVAVLAVPVITFLAVRGWGRRRERLGGVSV